jgi:hypothetical protein
MWKHVFVDASRSTSRKYLALNSLGIRELETIKMNR